MKMIIAEQIEEVRRCVGRARARGQSIGFVPTLGALHEAHFSLIRAARQACGFVVVSIFLNPTQFGPEEDLASYPQPMEQDLAACRRLGVELVFAPSVETMYGRNCLTQVTVSRLSEGLCGRSRPGHFAGVCTVVAKLFNIVMPDKAFFGAKDFQQARIIRKMVEDLNFPIEIVVCPTVREPDGLAMSSRNAYLTPQQRRQAAELYKALKLAGQMIEDSHPPAEKVIKAIRDHLAESAPDGKIDYVEIVDPESLQDVTETRGAVLVAAAVKFGKARLIDNLLVEAPDERS